MVMMLMAGSAAAGVALGGATQEPEPPRMIVANRPHQLVPVDAVVSQIRKPVVLDDKTTVALKEGTVVKIAPPEWEYREVRVPTVPGTYTSVLGTLAAAGADGWETTGLMFNTPGATVIVMKRQR
jgi:hypothetical protein